jgi:O-antigen ligase
LLGISGRSGEISVRFWVLVAFVALVFLMGGGSRDDVASLVILRPACALFAAYALTVARPGDFAQLRVPILLLLALGAWMVVQLIPLPHGLWSALPGRAAIARNDVLAGLGDIWRPLTLSPAKTMNSLGSLVVPITGLLLYGIQRDSDRHKILPIILILASTTALVGAAQKAMGGGGPLYFYEMTNLGEAVGLFANRNHNAVFLATTLLIGGYLFSERRRLKTGGAASIKPMLIAGACLLVISMLLINASRAGLLIGMLAIGLGVALYVAGGQREHDGHGRVPLMSWLPVAGVIGVSMIGAAILFVNAASFDRLVTLSIAEESRTQVFPQIVAMAKDNWLFGSGFGSFEYVYRQYEVSQFLREDYLNNAHDDWLQWIIEGGLPAILIALGFAVWLLRAALEHWRVRANNAPRTQMVAMALGVLLLLLLASALDYPLRVPSLMLYAILMVALVADPPEPMAKKSSRRHGRG